MKTAAIYARVSSDKQREENTIASQTAALVAFAREQQFEVPQEWVFEDDGYSGASLIRPGLERVRDLAAEGLIEAVLIYAPDRLSRRYAHQILLIEELARAGVETLFVRAPRGSTPEDELLVQFQGMIAEYERAQILERSRRGKRHRARQGEVGVLSGAPFGYRFIRKTDHSTAHYQIDEDQARVVRWMFELYSIQGLSIGAIARLLNEQEIPTCKRRGRWERSTVWGMLRNPAFKGQACFGKTTLAPRQRITRPIRIRGGIAPRNSASHERPRGDWITIAVPPIVSEETFALAQERLETNKTHAPRRTVTPSVVQGLVSCAKCGYALYRTSTRSSARAIHYYRCLGSDAWRRHSGSVCNNHPVRQDLLDGVVWTEIVRLLEDPELIQNELNRRLAAAREANPTKRREEALRRDLARIRKSIDRLLIAYQEGLLSLDELRERMPNLRRREQADSAELQAIVDQSVDRAAYLRLAETLATFLTRLRSAAGALDVLERQRVLRLLVKEILVGDDKIIIRHCIPLPMAPGDGPPAGSADPALPTTQILLTPFDKEMRHQGYQLTRWADDWVVTCRTRAEAEDVLVRAAKILEKLGVTLNREKTRIVHITQGFEFLGFKIQRGKGQLKLTRDRIKSTLNRRNLYAIPTQKSVDRFKDQIRTLTRRRTPLRMGELINTINPVIRGWGNYFCRSNVRKRFNQLDRWIVQRLWSHRTKRWRNTGWREYPTKRLRTEFKLVSLVALIPSLQIAKAHS